MKWLNLYAGFMAPFWKMRSEKAQKKRRLKTALEIGEKIREFRAHMHRLEKLGKIEDARTFRCYLETLDWVLNDNSQDQ